MSCCYVTIQFLFIYINKEQSESQKKLSARPKKAGERKEGG